MNAKELIERYHISLGPTPGTISVPNPKRLSPQEVGLISRKKPAILYELERRIWESKELIRRKVEGLEPIRVFWHMGSPLSGYVPSTKEDQKALEQLGIGRPIEGWGYYVPSEVVKFVDSQEFFTHQIRQFVQTPPDPDKDIREALEKARTSGASILVRKWIEDCDKSEIDCNLDVIELWAHPDGSTEVKRHHTY